MKLVTLWSKLSLGIQLLVALVLGVIAALIWPQFAGFYQFLGQAFIKLINMVIIPLIFPTIVVAVAGVIGKKSFGKILTKSLVYFFAVTTAITLLFVFASYYLGFGQGVNIGQTGGNLDGIANNVKFSEFLLGFIPSSLNLFQMALYCQLSFLQSFLVTELGILSLINLRRLSKVSKFGLKPFTRLLQ